MGEPSSDTISMLAALRGGDRTAWDALLDRVYGELKDLAQALWRKENVAVTLQPTALVHEAYLRLVGEARFDWETRAQFFAAAARGMRQLLIEGARARQTLKRGGDWDRITLESDVAVSEDGHLDLLALNDALDSLEQIDERQYRVVELRFFGGLTVEETASALGISPMTVKGDWRFARAWLRRLLTREARA